MIQRIRDWLHEREIDRLSKLCVKAMKSGDRRLAVHYWLEQGNAINARSWQQVRRMERRMGVR